jgi:KDO2-lipid IV(A) lauroyltransferase
MQMGKQKSKKRKKKKGNVVVDYLLYVLLRVGLVILYRFKVESVLGFANFLGDMMWKHYGRGKQRTIDHLKASYPEKDDAWIEQTGRRSFQHIVMLTVDMLFTPRLVKRDNWEQYSTYIDLERTKWLIQGGQPVLMVTGHYGNFEIMGYLMGLFGFKTYSVARPLDNRFISKYLYSIREKAGQNIIDKKGASEHMQQMIEEGANIGFIADQDAGRKGVFVDFFGRKASTYKSIGLLAMQYNMPISVACCRRVENRFFFEIEIQRLIMPEEWADKDKPLEWVTAEYTKAIEDFVRKDPSQYWWLHRRWKHRPKEERKAAKLKKA